MVSAYGGVLVGDKAFARPRVGRKLPLFLEDLHGLRRRAEVSCNRLRPAAECSELPSGGTGLGRLLEHAMVLRCAP